MFGVIVLILASVGFRIYVANFSNYRATYGSIGAVIVLEFWLYITALALLAGSEVNVVTEQYRGGLKDTGKKKAPGGRRAF